MTVISSTGHNCLPYFERTNNNNNNNIINSSNLLNLKKINSNNFNQEKKPRQISADAKTAGCCLIKTVISNILTFAGAMFERSRLEDIAQAKIMLDSIFDKFHRLRRKPDLTHRETQLNSNYSDNSSIAINFGMGASTTTMGNVMLTSCSNKKAGLINCSKVSSTKVTKKDITNQHSTELGFIDSFDDEVIDKICTLSPRLDQNEWLATHVLDLFDQVNILCGTISDVCTPVSCSNMSYPGVSKASWIDERGKRHNYSAMKYIDSVMTFCDASRSNQQLFPTKFGIPFSSNFEGHCKRMIRYLWHCCGHIYTKHWDLLGLLNLRLQYRLVLSHLAKISQMYRLLDAKEDVAICSTLQLIKSISQLESNNKANSVELPPSNNKEPEKQRPAKRLNSSDLNEYSMNTEQNVKSNDSLSRVKIAAAIDNKTPISLRSIFWQNQSNSGINFNYCSKGIIPISEMKSGSWGGNSAIITTNNSDATPNNIECTSKAQTNNASRFKGFAQTC